MVHCQGQTKTSAFRFKHSQVQTVVAQISGRFVKKPWGSGMNQLYFRAPEEEVARMVGTHATVSRSGLSQFSLLQMAVKGKVLVASHVWLFVTPWTVACQAPLSMGFSRQEYWSRLPCPPPGDLPLDLNLGLLHCRPISLPSQPQGKPTDCNKSLKFLKLELVKGNISALWSTGKQASSKCKYISPGETKPSAILSPVLLGS